MTMATSQSASRSEIHPDDKPKGFLARAFAHLFFRKNAVLAVHTFEDTQAAIKEVYRVMRHDSYRAQQQALPRERSSHTGPGSSKARSEPVLEDDARFASAVRYEVTIPMPLGRAKGR